MRCVLLEYKFFFLSLNVLTVDVLRAHCTHFLRCSSDDYIDLTDG